MAYKLYTGRQEIITKDFRDNSIDSCVTDPPYGFKFMGKKWDTQVPSIDEWKSIYRILKPGAFLVAFGGTRTYHRLVCNVEDAGFEIRDMLGWIYGSGFPKSHNIDDEHGTALKPAIEPIVLARKPLEGTVKQNYKRWGTGVLNINTCRIPGDPWKYGSQADIRGGGYNSKRPSNGFIHKQNVTGGEHGRWPANIQHDGSEEVLNIFPWQKSGAMTKPYTYTNTGHSLGKPAGATKQIHKANEGSAARFFYCGKASRSDRNAELNNNWPTVKPTNLMRYYIRLITPPNGLLIDPYMGSGSTGKACVYEYINFIGIDDEVSAVPLAEERIKFALRDRDPQIDIF